MRKLSHQKKRNLGLVYEFLSRAVADAVVAEDKVKAAKALKIISNHLSEGTELYPELSLHRQVINTRGVSERLARRIVDELRAAGIRMAPKRQIIENAKTELIHEINKTLGRDLFDKYRINNYTAHASVSILMSRGLNQRIDEGIEYARVEDHLVDFLTNESKQDIKIDKDASLFTYKTAVGLFEKEYGKELSQPQSELLREYVRVSLGGITAPFERIFQKQKEDLVNSLSKGLLDEAVKSDNDMTLKLSEAINELKTIKPEATDEAVERLMLFHNLKMEIDS